MLPIEQPAFCLYIYLLYFCRESNLNGVGQVERRLLPDHGEDGHHDGRGGDHDAQGGDHDHHEVLGQDAPALHSLRAFS